MWCAIAWGWGCSSSSRSPTSAGGFARPIRSTSLALIMLALVIVVGVESGGAKRWLGYGEISFQPSEMMKIALVLALARYYQWLPPNRVSWPHAVLPPLLMIGAPVCWRSISPISAPRCCSASSAAASCSSPACSWIYFVGALVGVIVVLPHVWERLHDYQKERILTFIDPDRDPLGSGYHILQSKIAIGSGGLIGKGFMQGTQSPAQFPAREAHRLHLHDVRRGDGLYRLRSCCLRSTFSSCCSSPIWRSDAAAPSRGWSLPAWDFACSPMCSSTWRW